MAYSQAILDTIKEYMSHSLHELGYNSIDDAPPKMKGKTFCKFYVEEIAGPLSNFEEDEIEDGLKVDGKDDLNIDYIYRQDESCLLIQSKFRTGKKQTLERDEIAGFFAIYDRIRDKSYLLENGNDYLIDLLDGIPRRTQFRFLFICSIDPSPENKKEFEHLETSFREKHPKVDVVFELKGLQDIREEYIRAQSIDQAIPEEIIIPIEGAEDTLSRTKIWAYLDLTKLVDPDEKYNSIICSVKGTVIKNIYQKHKEGLFNYNIRGYLGKNPINQRMTETIAKTPGEFFYCNNGISAICTDVQIRSTHGGNGRELVCKNFQIINGAQTTTTIGTTRSDDCLRNLRVLLRITRAEELKKEKGLNRSIIRYNNSQTVIRDSDFRANDDVQIQLEKALNEFSYRPPKPPVKKICYLPKRRHLKKEREFAYITMEKLAKLLYAFEQEPLLFQGKPKLLFDTSTEGKYWDIFGISGEEQPMLHPERIKEIAAICCLWLGISEWINSKQKSLSSKTSPEYQSTLAIWYHIAALGVVYRIHYADKTNRTKLWNRILDGSGFSNKLNLYGWFDKINEIILEKLEDAYAAPMESSNMESKAFNFRNWCRIERVWTSIQKKMERTKISDFQIGSN